VNGLWILNHFRLLVLITAAEVIILKFARTVGVNLALSPMERRPTMAMAIRSGFRAMLTTVD
jgi:hypothetical protein